MTETRAQMEARHAQEWKDRRLAGKFNSGAAKAARVPEIMKGTDRGWWDRNSSHGHKATRVPATITG